MKNRAFVLSVLLPILFSGCIMWDGGYTANVPVTPYGVTDASRVPLTYQITLKMMDPTWYGCPTVNDLQRRVEVALYRTGLFSEVKYGALTEGQAGYHIAFEFRQDGMNTDEVADMAAMSMATLFLVPTFGVVSFDATATVSVQGKPHFAVGKAEEMRAMFWLPLLPAGFFVNEWTAWDAIEQGSVNALVNEIAERIKRELR
ncbi:MAG: hypothetical protein J6334_04070 [Kiritimatiellae bacterium]|nr:hypothetical protein [Kiritimatiellia bacterium]